MRTQPLVSIVVAVKNETVLLRHCLVDLLAQTYKSMEIIIADDGSDQETKDTIAQFKDPRIKVVTLSTSKGQSAARNEAFKVATGSYIAIADADDRYHPERIEQQLDFMEIHPHIDACGTEFTVNKGQKTWELHYFHNEIFHRFLINNPIVHSSLFFKAELLENGFHYRSTYDGAEDYDVLAANRNKWFYHNINKPLVRYTVHQKKPEAVANQKAKARKVREKVLKEYLDDPTAEEIELHHNFCELEKGLSFAKIHSWIEKLLMLERVDSLDYRFFRHVLCRQAWIYIRKCNPQCSKKEKLTVLFHSEYNIAYFIKNALKIITGRPL